MLLQQQQVQQQQHTSSSTTRRELDGLVASSLFGAFHNMTTKTIGSDSDEAPAPEDLEALNLRCGSVLNLVSSFLGPSPVYLAIIF